MLREVLRQAADAGRVQAGHVDPFTRILLAAGNEMALVIALTDDVPAARAAAEAAIDEFLTRLRQPPSTGAGVPGEWDRLMRACVSWA